MSNASSLYQVFTSFCAFGAGKGSSENVSQGPALDNAKFAKFAKDTGIIDKSVTSTEIDITFNKFKPKNARKMDFESFKEALAHLATKKYPSKAPTTAYNDLVNLIVRSSNGPSVNATIPKATGIYDKLTDTSLYTGTHKNRFDEDGKGKGLEGRRDVPSLKGSQSSLAKTGFGSQSSLAKSQNLSASAEKLFFNKPISGGNKRGNEKVSKFSNEKLETKPTTAKKPAGGVFDRLTDSSQYTGAHKHRFNADGTGRGLAGRDSPSKSSNPGAYRGGDVKDLSQILRA